LEQWNYLIRWKWTKTEQNRNLWISWIYEMDYNDNEENQTEFNTIERRFCRHNDWKLFFTSDLNMKRLKFKCVLKITA
jgi:hypothetical protein